MTDNDNIRNIWRYAGGKWACEFTDTTFELDVVLGPRNLMTFTFRGTEKLIPEGTIRSMMMPIGKYLWLADHKDYSIAHADADNLGLGIHKIAHDVGIYECLIPFKRVR